MHRRVNILGVTIFGSLLLLACGGTGTYPAQQPGTTGYPATQPAAGTQPGAVPGAQPVATPGATANPQPAPTAQPAATNAQEVDASMAAPVQPMLQQLAKTQAPAGAKPLGNMIVANFSAPGQKFEKQVQLTANKCYTVVAAGAPGVSEVNLKFMSLIPLAPPAAVDNSTGPQATLGGNPNCWKQIMFSAPMNLVIEVPQGQGLVGAQIYEK